MSLFDGMASTLNDAFGALVTYLPASGPSTDIQSVFRREPVEAQDADGHVILTVGPSWTVPKTLVPGVQVRDRIQPGDGKTYEIQNIWPSGSPAEDARVICECFEVD